jgi:hypothetical protein
LARIARALDNARLPYVVVGGQAVLVYGDPRFTKDIDITLGVDSDKLEAVRKICAELSLVSKPKDAETFVKQTNVFPVKEEGTNIRERRDATGDTNRNRKHSGAVCLD